MALAMPKAHQIDGALAPEGTMADKKITIEIKRQSNPDTDPVRENSSK